MNNIKKTKDILEINEISTKTILNILKKSKNRK